MELTADQKIKKAKKDKPKIKGIRYARTPLGRSKSEKEELVIKKRSKRAKVKKKLKEMVVKGDYDEVL